jgi:hypothetical protein
LRSSCGDGPAPAGVAGVPAVTTAERWRTVCGQESEGAK